MRIAIPAGVENLTRGRTHEMAFLASHNSSASTSIIHLHTRFGLSELEEALESSSLAATSEASERGSKWVRLD